MFDFGVNLFENPETVEINRLPMNGIPPAAEERFSLDGKWDFKLLPSPETEFDPEKDFTDKITVPSNWTLGGFGDLPIYTNVQMPFDKKPPLLLKKIPPESTAELLNCRKTSSASASSCISAALKVIWKFTSTALSPEWAKIPVCLRSLI